MKSEFGRKKSHEKTGLELSTRIRKQNVVPIFLGFEIILLALDGLRGILGRNLVSYPQFL